MSASRIIRGFCALALLSAVGCAGAPGPSADARCGFDPAGTSYEAGRMTVALTLRNTGGGCNFRVSARDGATASLPGSPMAEASVVRPPRFGTASADPDRIRYAPAPGFAGEDAFEATARFPDSEVPVLVRVTVLPP